MIQTGKYPSRQIQMKFAGRGRRRMSRAPGSPMAPETGELAPSIGWHCDYHDYDGGDDDACKTDLKKNLCNFS